MKKMIPLILTLALLLSMSATVFVSATSDDLQKDVTATYKQATATPTVISVGIDWVNMSFTYNEGSGPVWNTTTHQYDPTTPAGWEASNATITITNDSAVVLQTGLSYTQKDGYTGVSMHFTDPNPYVGSSYTSATEGGTPCQVTIQVVPDGILPDTTPAGATIGQITVEVNEVSDPSTVPAALLGKFEEVYGVGTNPASLKRGTAYFKSETDTSTIESLCYSVSDFLADPDETDTDKNVELNNLITTYYGALAIKQ